MSCSPDRIKDFFFGELTEAECGDLRAHLGECAACREELDRLRLTRAALQAAPAAEPPRRIAFVSDKVFEPSWLARLWASGPRLGFASALVLAVAIVVHAAWRPAPQPAAIDQAALEAKIAAEVVRQMQPAIQAAVAASEQRQSRLVETNRKELEVQFQETFGYLVKKYGVLARMAANYDGGRP